MIIIKNKKLLLILIAFLIAFLFTSRSIFSSSPSIESTPITTAKEGVFYTYDVDANDYNKDTLTYSLTASPTGMTINSNTGAISWAPIEDQIGENEVVVKVSDGNKSVTQSFIITVVKAKLASIEVLPSTVYLQTGRSMAITSVIVYYDNGTNTNIALNNCTYESDIPGIAILSSSGVITGTSYATTSYNLSSTNGIIMVSYTEDSITKTDTVLVVFTQPYC